MSKKLSGAVAALLTLVLLTLSLRIEAGKDASLSAQDFSADVTTTVLPPPGPSSTPQPIDHRFLPIILGHEAGPTATPTPNITGTPLPAPGAGATHTPIPNTTGTPLPSP